MPLPRTIVVPKGGSRFALSACCLVGLLCCRLVRLRAVRHLSTLRMHDLAVHVDIWPIMGLLAAILFVRRAHQL